MDSTTTIENSGERDGSAELDGERQHEARLVEVGRLAAMANHELRQPLLGIKAFSEMIAERPELPDDARDWARKIHAQASRMERMVQGLGNLSRPAKRASERVSLDGHLQELLGFAAFLFREPTVKLRSALRSNAEVMVSVDELSQVVLNLLANARDAVQCAGGGRVQIITVADEQNGDVLIGDDGAGLPRDALRALEAGFKTTKKDGTGLGLKVSGAIARRHGGSLELIDERPALMEPPVRTLFRLRLPRAR